MKRYRIKDGFGLAVATALLAEKNAKRSPNGVN